MAWKNRVFHDHDSSPIFRLFEFKNDWVVDSVVDDYARISFKATDVEDAQRQAYQAAYSGKIGENAKSKMHEYVNRI